ncbi:MAG: rhodanese-like domain-containing protein, partial [Verrucomicrobiales bacterium]
MRKLTLPFIALSALVALSNCNKQGGEPAGAPEAEQAAAFIKDVDVAAAAELIKASDPPTVVDVRTPEEFAAGHIEGAINVDFKDPGFKDSLGKLDRDQSYLI